LLKDLVGEDLESWRGGAEEAPWANLKEMDEAKL